MSSGFVSGGTADKPIERDDEWLEAQQELEATRRRKEEESRQEGGKTLFEVLQANKAAKQEAFEESIRLKNQFRNLDEDEVEFLDSVLESTRAKEEAVKKETAEQLDMFRRQQDEADKAILSESDTPDPSAPGKAHGPSITESDWAVNAKKRKRTKDNEGLKGIKLRKSSPSDISPKATTSTVCAGSPTPSSVSKELKAVLGSPVREQAVAMDSSPSPKRDTKSSCDSSATSKSETTKRTLPELGLAGYGSSDED